jgi:hypothetical protein
VAAVITRYTSAGNSSTFRDSLILLLESIRDVAARSEWELIPVALCMSGEDNVPAAAISEFEALGFRVKMEDPVVRKEEISENALPDFMREVNHKYKFGGILRDYLKLKALRWTEYDRVLVLDTDTMLLG